MVRQLLRRTEGEGRRHLKIRAGREQEKGASRGSRTGAQTRAQTQQPAGWAGDSVSEAGRPSPACELGSLGLSPRERRCFSVLAHHCLTSP